MERIYSEGLVQRLLGSEPAQNFAQPAGLKSVESRLQGGIEGYVNSTIPVKRVGQPEDIANAVAFLASEASGYITGLTLSVNGGRYMQ